MDSVRVSLVWLVQTLQRRWFFLFTLFCLYYYHVRLGKNMSCECKSQSRDCWVYFLVPGLILILVQMWLDLGFHRALGLLCGGLQGKVLPVLLKHVLEAVFVGMLWIESVLLDGDWYVCCGRANIRCNPYIPGRPDSDELRNESQVIALLLVFLVVLVAAILSWLPWRRWCSPCEWPEAVLEEAELIVSQRIRTAAREQLRNKLDQSGSDWRKWAELEKDLIENRDENQVQSSVLMSSLNQE